ncbi:hypothetical protein CaCOL14_000733 [Colletotrichum acutatum]
MSELAVGQTVRLSDGRTGIVRFAGGTHFASGDWVGIELEDDSGKNDGSVQGERYFDCALGHGMFVRPTTLAIIAQAPAPAAKPAARRPSRPSSFNPGAGRTTSDTGVPAGEYTKVTDQVTHKTARISNIEYRAIANYHAVQYTHTGYSRQNAAKRGNLSQLHGTSANTRQQNHEAALDIFSCHTAYSRKTQQWSTIHLWTDG